MKIPHHSRPFRESALAALVLLAVSLASATAATFTVLNSNDSGAGSLRQALADAAANAGPDTIHFDAALDGQTIALSSELTVNDATGSVTIDGYSSCATPNGITLSGGDAVRILRLQTGSDVILRRLVLTEGNTAGSANVEGGAIFNQGTFAMTDCTIENCRSEDDGGGLANMRTALLTPSTATLERCILSGNSCPSTALGGGIYNEAICTLRSCTLSGNSGGFGGAVYNESSGAVVMRVENSTIAGNQADFGGGIGSASSAPQLHLENSIVADNTATIWPDLSATVTTVAGRNLVEDPTGASGLGAGDVTGVDPQLGSLADNGGPTRTHLPEAGSAAIDAGVPTTATPSVDQRFFARQVDMGDTDGDGEILDIGAAEVAGPGAAGGAGQIEISNPAEYSVRYPRNYRFGGEVKVLPNGNIVVIDSRFDAGGTLDVGAVYLFDGDTLDLISTLTGTTEGDQVGSGGVTILSNGNFVVSSPYWANEAALDAGAVTWGSGTVGVSGTVSAANSLVGAPSVTSSFLTGVGGGGITALSTGNYVVSSPLLLDRIVGISGAVTWGDGTTGVSGVVSAANSLVGEHRPVDGNDVVGYGGVTALTNGNYVVSSPDWNGGGPSDAGAVTWGDGTTGVVGLVGPGNSLTGSSANDRVGDVFALANGNYVVDSPQWDNGATSTTNVGAVTWVNGSTGMTGVVSAANSLIGSSTDDHVGNSGVTILPNGNFVVRSRSWDNGPTMDVGAVTWGNGSTGLVGVVSAANSLVGSSAGEEVGIDRVTALANGNYVVSNPVWDDGGATDVGAVTWGDGAAGVIGTVSAANSLVGSTAGNLVGGGGITALTNGNYVVASPDWDSATAVDVGAVTWGNGATGTTGVVAKANSLVGSKVDDRVGLNSVTALTNGNYVVASPDWDSATAVDVGAVTWGNGATGTTGVVAEANSLVGSSPYDQVGGSFNDGSVIPLVNGNYVVGSGYWDNGPALNAGAATWGNGTTGVTGVVSAANSLVGSNTFDRVGAYDVTILTNGNYVVGTPSWDDGATGNVGAVTWGDGTAGVTGVVSAANSLVGTTAGDFLGDPARGGGVTALADGNYVVSSPEWDNGATVQAGAVTQGNGVRGTAGPVSPSNSVLGVTVYGGSDFVYDNDPLKSRLIVGDPAGNRLVVFGNLPEIAVELPAGVDLPNCETAVFGAPVGAMRSRTFTVRNADAGTLAGLFVTIDGPDAALFTVTSAPAASVGAFGSTTFTVRFAPTSPGTKTVVLHVSNNDPDEHPFDINLSGRVLVSTDDTDGDGLNDVSEFELANLGFDWEASQPSLVAEMFGNLDDALPNLNAEGYFTTAQVQTLYIDTPLIQGDLTAGTATLTLWVEKSTNLVEYDPFPMTDPQTTINGLGQLEFEFPLTGGAAFFKVGTSGD